MAWIPLLLAGWIAVDVVIVAIVLVLARRRRNRAARSTVPPPAPCSSRTPRDPVSATARTADSRTAP